MMMKDYVCPSCLRICFAITFFLSFIDDSFAQFDSLGLNTEWRRGSILLDDNSSLKGLVQFNDKLGMIKFRKTVDSPEESFVETSVVAMEFYDDDKSRLRNFAVFNINEEETGRQYALLFEVLMEFTDFALLTRVQPVNVAARQRSNSLGNIPYARVGYEQFEYLCLVDKHGDATVILRVSELERNKLSVASKIQPELNKQALEKYLKDDWDQFRAIVKSHKLNMRKRDDFMRAFEYLREVKMSEL